MLAYTAHLRHKSVNALTFKDNSLQVVELSCQPDLQIVVNTSLHTVSSTFFRIRVSLRLTWLITHQSRNDSRIPRNHGYVSCSQEMYTRTMAILQRIHVCCVLAMSQVVGWAICAIVVLVGYIRSVLAFQTPWNIDELRNGWTALSPPTLPTRQPLLTSIPIHAIDGNPFTIM